MAKDVIQICVVSASKVKENKALSARQFENWLASSSSSTVVFEACMTANYWYQRAVAHGHHAKVISANVVRAVRQNQKTDANDALAIVQAASLPNLRLANVKSRYQQQLQSLMRMRELTIKQRVAAVNQLKAIMLRSRGPIKGSPINQPCQVNSRILPGI
ncbi:IS110 family transposase [Bowmanella yangjiangensis]|uniref:Transposase n=1 Tax=Bowmanella yangjiangensis TaxID=2811230 RepID=A0ABS3CT71_9ALTE|nr:transposase [Bowmanella yangjiangensis]MBN7820324.1 transposase [Bowmanella yangjiangensis]